VLPVSCDVRHYDQVEAMLAATLEKFGKVDALVNNAAGNFISPTERLSANAFDTIIDIVLNKLIKLTGIFTRSIIYLAQATV